ncbi:hypothetical protein ACF0H5_010487 [Mactra antiquata]
MSDSDEDFASADEGEVDSTPASGSSKELKAEKDVPTVSNVEKKDDSKPPSKSDSFKSQSQENTSTGKKKGKGKDEKKNDENKASEASGGKGNVPAKESEVKSKGKKGKNKDRGKKNANKGVEPKENKTESEKSSTVPNTQEENVEEIKPEPVDISDVQEASNTSSDNVKVDNARNDKEENDKADTDVAKSQVVDNESASAKDNVDISPKSNIETDSNSGSKGDNKDLSEDNLTDSPSGKLTIEQKADMIKSPSSQSISRPKPDHTDKQEEVLDKLSSSAKEKSSGGWGWGWGSSLLDVASNSVSTFTNQVGEGFNTVLETVESTLNMPNPEELARQNTADNNQDDDNDVSKPEKDGNKTVPKEEEKSPSLSKDGEPDKTAEDKTETSNQSAADKGSSESSSGWFSSWGVSNITKMVESTSKNLVTGSLDVLETLGKKTFDVINEHDPGLRKARAFLHDQGDKPNLSAILRDAKEQEEVRVQHEKETEEARKAHFGSLFDDYQGLAHLEALEMLSNQCEKKVNVILNNLPAETIASIKPQLLLIKQNFEIDDDDDDDDVVQQEFDKLVTDILHNLNVGTTPDKLIKTRQSIEDNVKQCNETAENSKIKEIHRVAISSLAEFTSKSIEQFHKAGELILIKKTKDYNFVDCSNLLRSFTKILTTETGILSTNFTECLNKMEGDDEIKVNHLVTNIFLEASNSSSYIQDGFRLLLPVIQQAAIECSQEPE